MLSDLNIPSMQESWSLTRNMITVKILIPHSSNRLFLYFSRKQGEVMLGSMVSRQHESTFTQSPVINPFLPPTLQQILISCL